MKIKVEVVNYEKYPTKQKVIRHSLSCVDVSTSRPRLHDGFDYFYSAADAEKFGEPCRLKGETIVLGVSAIRSGFGGRIRMSGEVIECLKSA